MQTPENRQSGGPVSVTPGRPIRVGVWNFYEEITTDGFLFKNVDATNGHQLLKPWCELYRFGQANGFEFLTLDQGGDLETLDAVMFMDRPRAGSPLAEAALKLNIVKYLLVLESPIIRPDNFDAEYQKQFDRILTWSDSDVDGQRIIKLNYVIDPVPYNDFPALKAAFSQRKLCTMIAGAKGGYHPSELYSHRVRTIQWFEASAPQDFDLYGQGWKSGDFPSYRGAVADKMATLAGYRFAICYENAKDYPGYITEKILDCLRAGVVPVYGGAPNIERWIPADCYIDFRDFQTYHQLYAFLSGMDAETHAAYLDRIAAFLASDKAYPFSIRCFVDTVTGLLRSDVTQRRAAQVGLRALQNPETLEIYELPAEVEAPSPEASPPESEAARTRALCRTSTGRGDLVIYSGYGDELPVFLRARSLWAFYMAHYPHVQMDFLRDSETLAHGEISTNGYDMLVGCGETYAREKHDAQGYGGTGVWSRTQNAWQIFRQICYYKHLLQTRAQPFFVYYTTITSVVDIRALEAIVAQMPVSGCFAGMPARINTPGEFDGLAFPCGTNCLLSSDVVEMLVDRYDAEHRYAGLPNDVWQGLVLKDVPRIPLPFFSFTRPRMVGTDLHDVRQVANAMRRKGHYHFRVKTTGEAMGLGAREEVDPWVMLQVMEEILSADLTAGAAGALIADLAEFCGVRQGVQYHSQVPDDFFQGRRTFELNDQEIQ